MHLCDINPSSVQPPRDVDYAVSPSTLRVLGHGYACYRSSKWMQPKLSVFMGFRIYFLMIRVNVANAFVTAF
jgi:hypothetical protein